MMRRALLMVVALLTVSVAWTGGAAASSEAGHRGGPPDTFVTDWDAHRHPGIHAPRLLSPAEGHTIFAYVAIAVYDSVMAVEGGYEPFAVDVDAPAAHRPKRRLPRPPTASSATTSQRRPPILDPAYTASLATISRTARRRRTASPSGRASPTALIAQRAGDGFRAR